MAGLRDTVDTTSHHDTSPLLLQRGLELQISTLPTPLPRLQIAIVCAIRLVDPVAFTQIFPYVNELVESLHVTDDPSRIGFYSGLVECAFTVAQLFSIYHWAWISDRHGRRPVVIIGTSGIAITTVVLGLSRTFTGILVARFLSGLYSGNIAAIQSILGEITDSTNQATAVSIYGVFWPLGSTLGPLIGAFSDPAHKFPSIFDIEFLREYPYFMPCFMASLVAAFAAVFSYISLDETLPAKRQNIKKKPDSNYGTIGPHEPAPGVTEPPSLRTLLALSAIRSLALSGFAFGFLYTSFDVIFALFCYSPIQAGGIAFTTSQIGYSLAIGGFISASIQLCILPALLRTFHAGNMYSFCMCMWTPTFLMFPILNIVARNGLDERTGLTDSHTHALLWAGISLVMVFSRIACLSSPLSMILSRQHAPDSSSLGATNGLVGFAVCFARAFAPAMASACFAFSTGSNICGGHLWVIIMFLMSYLGYHTTKVLGTKKGDGRGI